MDRFADGMIARAVPITCGMAGSSAPSACMKRSHCSIAKPARSMLATVSRSMWQPSGRRE
jgi:hypothetical protein